METDAAGTSRRRPSTWLLTVFGAALLVVLAMYWMGGSTTPGEPASNPVRSRPGPTRQPLDPASLDVRLEALKEERPGPDNLTRNPFRFEPKAPPPLPPSVVLPKIETPPPPVDAPPAGPPPPPPITLKFLGVIEAPGVGKLAALSDCRYTFRGREGEIIEGRYRLVKIGVESITIEYLDGQGRTTIRLTGQGCENKVN
jgi:hypothetical protein